MMTEKPDLTLDDMIDEAVDFCFEQSALEHPAILGVTDGKAVGTYIEQLFQQRLESKYSVEIGNSARGVDIPSADINTDIKTTSSKKPQSSTPYRTSRQKVFGLGHNILIFVYEKHDNGVTSRLEFKNCTFIPSDRTADYTLTKQINELKARGTTFEEVRDLLVRKGIPGGDAILDTLTEQVLDSDVKQGYITISNALQWRLDYGRVVNLHGTERAVFNYDFNG